MPVVDVDVDAGVLVAAETPGAGAAGDGECLRTPVGCALSPELRWAGRARALGLAGPEGVAGRSTVEPMSRLKASYRSGELAELLADADQPPAEDVSVTEDGRRLDTADAVIQFFDELRASRSHRSSSA